MKKIILNLAAVACICSACNSNSGSMAKGNDSTSASAEKNKQTALEADKALAKKDFNLTSQSYAPDFIEYGNGESKPMKNIDSIKMMMSGLYNAFPDFKGENFKAVAEGDTVIITADWSGTFKKDFMGVKATQKSYKLFDADIYIFNKAGKIASHKSVQSDATIFAQLGITMPSKK